MLHASSCRLNAAGHRGRTHTSQAVHPAGSALSRRQKSWLSPNQPLPFRKPAAGAGAGGWGGVGAAGQAAHGAPAAMSAVLTLACL